MPTLELNELEPRILYSAAPIGDVNFESLDVVDATDFNDLVLFRDSRHGQSFQAVLTQLTTSPSGRGRALRPG